MSKKIEASLLVTCPHCKQANFSVRGLRSHVCKRNDFSPISKQDWWVVVDKARVAAGLPEMPYGFTVYFRRHDSTEGQVYGAGSKGQVVMKARLKPLFKCVELIEAMSYATYCRAYGIPGSKM